MMQVILQFVTDLFCVALFFPAFFDGQKLTNVEKLVKKPIFNAASWLNLPSWSSNMGPGQMQFTSDSAKNVSRRRMQTRFADASHGVCACRRVSRLSALLRRSYVLGGFFTLFFLSAGISCPSTRNLLPACLWCLILKI